MLVVQCDACKAVEPSMRAVELKTGTSDGKATGGVAAHLCNACWDKLEVGGFVHKLVSAGGHELLPAAPQIAPPNAPVAVDPRFLKKVQR